MCDGFWLGYFKLRWFIVFMETVTALGISRWLGIGLTSVVVMAIPKIAVSAAEKGKNEKDGPRSKWLNFPSFQVLSFFRRFGFLVYFAARHVFGEI